MKCGHQEGELWPLARDGEEVPLPWWRVKRYLDRLDTKRRAQTMARLNVHGLVPPCAVRPSVLFRLSNSPDQPDDVREIAPEVVKEALRHWRRLSAEEQERLAREMDPDPSTGPAADASV